MIKKPIIGSIEHVQIPVHGDSLILAKVDTGADGSSIWASDISQVDGVLSYSFFGPGSMYFTGLVRKTKRFKVTTITNSFGHSEVRYKVYLKIIIGRTEIKGWFSLSDRSRNRYPILLGKSLLKGKFLVDVSQNHAHGTDILAQEVLVVSSSRNTKEYLAKVEQQLEDVPIEVSTFKDMLFDINGSLSEITDVVSGKRVSQFALTYVKSHWNYPEPASALAEFIKYKNGLIVDKELEDYTSRSKLSEMMKLSLNGISVPRSFGGFSNVLLKAKVKIQQEIGFPLVLKVASSDKGRDNYLIDTPEVYDKILAGTGKDDIYIVQQFVPNDGFYRVNVFGSNPSIVVYRSAHPHKEAIKRHLNKPSGGVNAELVDQKDLPSAMLDISVRAALCMGRQVAGVDILAHKQTGEWYVLEVNNSPQIRTGAFVDEKTKEFAKYIKERLSK